MSTAHRPTWDPAQAKDVKGGSRQFSVRDMAAHTKLKFRQECSSSHMNSKLSTPHRQPGQTSAAEVSKRDLRAELLAAEQEARDRKRKAEGKPPLAVENGSAGAITAPADDEANKRRKLLQEALEMDKDDEDEDEEEGKEDKSDDDE